MSDAASDVIQEVQGRGLRWATAVLGAVVALLLVYLVLIIPTGTDLIPGTTTGDQREADVIALRNAANQQMSTFLNQDYRVARTTMNALVSGSTGAFHDKLVGSSVTQINASAELRTVATGIVQKLSVSRLGQDDATLLAVVTQTVTNTQTAKVKKSGSCAAGSVCNRYYVLLSYQRVGGHWKMSDLEYLPL